MNDDCSDYKTRGVIQQDVNKIIPRILEGKDGEAILYHTGYLQVDARPTSFEQEAIECRLMRHRIQENYDMGRIELVQRKLDNYVYEYLAIIKKFPYKINNYFRGIKYDTPSWNKSN